MKQTLSIRIPDDLRDELERISKSESKPVQRPGARIPPALYSYLYLPQTEKNHTSLC